MSDHELDRRYADQAFKLDVTKQIADIKGDLKINTEKTEIIKEEVQDLHEKFDTTMNGDHGQTARLILVEDKVTNLKKDLTLWLTIAGLVVVILGNRLSPIICDWIYQKTHIKIFQSPIMEVPPPPRRHITHVRYRYVIENPSSSGTTE